MLCLHMEDYLKTLSFVDLNLTPSLLLSHVTVDFEISITGPQITTASSP